MSFLIAYHQPHGAIHLIPELLAMPHELWDVLVVSQRTTALINDFSRFDVAIRHRWAAALFPDYYSTPEGADPEWRELWDLVDAFRLEVIPMTNPIADGLQAIAAAIAAQQPCTALVNVVLQQRSRTVWLLSRMRQSCPKARSASREIRTAADRI